MLYDFTEFRKAAPNYDCGLCGNATCSTFARRLLLNINKITDCPILQHEGYSENRNKIEEMMKSGIVHTSSAIIIVPGLRTKYAHPNYFEDHIEKLPTRFLDYDTALYLLSLLWKLEAKGDKVEVIDTVFGNLRFLITTSGRISLNIGEQRTEDKELTSILYKVLWGAANLHCKAEYAPRTVVPSLNMLEGAA